MKKAMVIKGLAGAAVLLLAGCGSYSGSSEPVSGGNGNNGGGGGAAKDEASHFSSNVAPNLDFCRTCHMPGGVADTDAGKRFMLSSDKSKDYTLLKASWNALGRGVDNNLILQNASGQHTHSGGAPWPVGSAPYTNMKVLLGCWDNPGACAGLLGGGVGGGGTQLPLLGSTHAQHEWYSFCEGKPDDAALPTDPRSLIKPGVNAGKAVHYNFFWKDCSAADGPGNHAPATCGELRTRLAGGKRLMQPEGQVGVGGFMIGDYADGTFVVKAEDYNQLWKTWGLSSRPDNFDRLAAERYGFPSAARRNPYPLPGENPNDPAHPGGSGQLPAALTQVRNGDGSYTGRIAMTCHGCHSTQMGTPEDGEGLGLLYGGGGSTSEFGLALEEIFAANFYKNGDFSLFNTALALAPYTPYQIDGARGISSPISLFILVLFGLPDVFKDPLTTIPNGILPLAAKLANAPAPGEYAPSPWWNMGRKTYHFTPALGAGDAMRFGTFAYLPYARPPEWYAKADEAQQWSKDNNWDMNAWFMSLKSPKYPGDIDTALAEQGAILFHSKNLWAEGLNNPVTRRPEGNGSCAGCHGAYSPRYVNDPAYLDSPELAGTTGYIVPKEIIGTDPAYVDAYPPDMTEWASTFSFVFYSETYGQELDCTAQNRDALRGSREIGYGAPPLHGVWATAPYFHNNSVPNIAAVLDPPSRPAYWRRLSAPARSDQEGKVVMGFDTNLQRAYDFQNLGWKYEDIACGTYGLQPYVNCNGSDGNAITPYQELMNWLQRHSELAQAIRPPVALLSREDLEKRKIYNTRDYSRSNAGHEFTAVLTEQERRAILEYLKTL